jgi:hypothetical protein
MRTYYRLQDADRDPAELLDPDHQWSSDWSDINDPRQGVSVCATPYALTSYFAARAESCDYDADFLSTLVMVEVEAILAEEEDQDAAEGALLVIPTRIVSATPLDDDMIAAICG